MKSIKESKVIVDISSFIVSQVFKDILTLSTCDITSTFQSNTWHPHKVKPLTWLYNYFVLTVESVLTDVESTAVESVVIVVESVAVGLLETPPPQATNVVAIAKIAITFFMFVCFCLINFLYNKYTKYILGKKIFLAVGAGVEPAH